MGLKAKRQIRCKGKRRAVSKTSSAKAALRDLCDIRIDWLSLILLTALTTVTLFNIVTAHAQMVMTHLGGLIGGAVMQLALILP